MILELLKNDGLTPLKKTASEYASPCPSCGGVDRFIIFADSDRYWCRQCSASGDSIQYMRTFHGLTFKEATVQADRPKFRRRPVIKQPVAPPAGFPTIIRGAHKALVESYPDRLRWLLDSRGISPQTAKRFNLGWIDSDLRQGIYVPAGLVIPWQDTRIRIRLKHPQGKKTYHIVKGSNMEPMVIGDHFENTAIIVESELDAILLAQEIERPVFIVALGSSSRNLDKSLIDRLNLCPIVLISLDSDKAGRVGVMKLFRNVDNAFHAPIPSAAGKDHTEAFMNGFDLNEWLGFAMQLVADEIERKLTLFGG